ncbi:MAG TPA: hypothetical protein VGA66_11580 [Mycobacterium sp.]
MASGAASGRNLLEVVGALVGDRVQTKEPVALDFSLDELAQP